MRKPPEIVEPNWHRLIDRSIASVEQYFPDGLDRTLTIQSLEKARQLHLEQVAKKSGGAVSIK